MVKGFSNGRALFEVHRKHIDFEYPPDQLFEAVISQGVVGKVTKTSDAVPVNVDPQVSPQEQSIVQPAIGVKVKKSVYEYQTPAPPLTNEIEIGEA